ncbi:hypothetical protein JRQ81_004881 [Phrynocephalus forsythii]|uniref:Uncharacterized protein n=1 Tax=Phrynocephalus forsythii TaxID=171643 RepID=A0A9Q0Y5S1_9SAUR|nr:hypothetical protein JRQ81_004881 [Phrynocephalus forsythii]
MVIEERKSAKMGDQQMYKTNHNDGESMYYHQQHMNSLAPLNHNYGTIDTSQESSLSPSFTHDSMMSKSIGLMDSPRQASWTHLGSGNHLPIRNNQNVMWSPAGQGEAMDGYEHLSPQSNEVRLQKMTSGALHKLDSFTQVFTNQNLRIQVNNASQIIQSQPLAMENANDSALRQLLSQKPAVEPQPVQRYQQVPSQVHQGFTGAQPKQHMHMMQYQQSPYYDNQQHLAHLQMHPAVSPGQAHLQQMHAQHLLPQQLPQDQYYLQEHPPHPNQHRLLLHEMQQQQQQQQRQCPIQRAQYYPAQPMMQQLQQQQQQQQQVQMQLPPYHRDPEQKPLQDTRPYAQDRGRSVQLIQLGASPQYFYQDQQQPFRQMYPQSVLPPLQPPPQQPTGDARQPDRFPSDNKAQALLGSQFGLPGAEGTEGQAQPSINQPLMSPTK